MACLTGMSGTRFLSQVFDDDGKNKSSDLLGVPSPDSGQDLHFLTLTNIAKIIIFVTEAVDK
jgi:hypothetical protein